MAAEPRQADVGAPAAAAHWRGGAVRGRTGQSGDGSPGDKEEEKWTGGITREQRRL